MCHLSFSKSYRDYFTRIYNLSPSTAMVARKLGIRPSTVSVYASVLRRAGYKLKYFAPLNRLNVS